MVGLEFRQEALELLPCHSFIPSINARAERAHTTSETLSQVEGREDFQHSDQESQERRRWWDSQWTWKWRGRHGCSSCQVRRPRSPAAVCRSVAAPGAGSRSMVDGSRAGPTLEITEVLEGLAPDICAFPAQEPAFSRLGRWTPDCTGIWNLGLSLLKRRQPLPRDAGHHHPRSVPTLPSTRPEFGAPSPSPRPARCHS